MLVLPVWTNERHFKWHEMFKWFLCQRESIESTEEKKNYQRFVIHRFVVINDEFFVFWAQRKPLQLHHMFDGSFSKLYTHSHLSSAKLHFQPTEFREKFQHVSQELARIRWWNHNLNAAARSNEGHFGRTVTLFLSYQFFFGEIESELLRLKFLPSSMIFLVKNKSLFLMFFHRLKNCFRI